MMLGHRSWPAWQRGKHEKISCTLLRCLSRPCTSSHQVTLAVSPSAVYSLQHLSWSRAHSLHHLSKN